MNGSRETPRPSAADMQRALATELSLAARIGHTLLLLASLGVGAVTAALLLTEPGLPARTRAAFGVMTLIGLSWAAFAAWVLTRRRVLFARHRVIAGRLAVGFCALFTLGAAVVAPAGPPRYSAVITGVTMLAVAVLLLLRARHRFEQLSAHRAELERQLAARGGAQS